MNGKEGMTGLERGDAICPYMKNTPSFSKKTKEFPKKELSLFQKDEAMFPKGSFLRLL